MAGRTLDTNWTLLAKTGESISFTNIGTVPVILSHGRNVPPEGSSAYVDLKADLLARVAEGVCAYSATVTPAMPRDL